MVQLGDIAPLDLGHPATADPGLDEESNRPLAFMGCGRLAMRGDVLLHDTLPGGFAVVVLQSMIRRAGRVVSGLRGVGVDLQTIQNDSILTPRPRPPVVTCAGRASHEMPGRGYPWQSGSPVLQPPLAPDADQYFRRSDSPFAISGL